MGRMDDRTSLNDLVASEIRAWLGRRRLTGRQLAAKMSRSQTWTATRLRGEQDISLNDLAAIADALNVQITDLLPSRASARPTDKAYSPPMASRRTRRFSRPRSTVVRHGSTGHPIGQRVNAEPTQTGRAERRPAIQAWTHTGVTP